jgi:hypothetical protein
MLGRFPQTIPGGGAPHVPHATISSLASRVKPRSALAAKDPRPRDRCDYRAGPRQLRGRGRASRDRVRDVARQCFDPRLPATTPSAHRGSAAHGPVAAAARQRAAVTHCTGLDRMAPSPAPAGGGCGGRLPSHSCPGGLVQNCYSTLADLAGAHLLAAVGPHAASPRPGRGGAL